MNIIFAGTPEFSAASLRALLAEGHHISLVLTQPDRPAGRGMRVTGSPVKMLALERGLPVFQPVSLRDETIQARLAREACDVMVVAAYGLILPAAVLAMPAKGCINVHASLLPRWRGAAPIQRAILAGDTESGVSIMAMDAGLDTGAVYSSQPVAIEPEETATSLHDKLADAGAQALIKVLGQLQAADMSPLAQTESGVTYAAKIEKSEAALDFTQHADVLHRQVRAFDPFPGCLTQHAGLPLKIWAARIVSPDDINRDASTVPGEILSATAEGVCVACGEGALLLTELQKSGGRRLPARDFLAGATLKPGDHLG